MDRINNFENDTQDEKKTEFSHLSPFFKHNHLRRKSIAIPSPIPLPIEDIEGIDREHETKKKKHNATLGKNFFIKSSNANNRSIIKATRKMKKVIPLYNRPVPEDADVVDWNQVHKPNEIIDDENENIVLLTRILDIEPNSVPIGFKQGSISGSVVCRNWTKNKSKWFNNEETE